MVAVLRGRISPLTWPVLAGLLGAALLAGSGYAAGARLVQTRVPGSLAQPRYATGLALWLLGTALLVAAWWWARRAAGDGGLRPRWVLGTAALWALPLALAPPIGSRDVYSYAAQGDVFAHGLDPYEVGPDALPSVWIDAVSRTWQGTPAPYGPLFLLVARAVAVSSGGSLVLALALFRLIAVLGLLLVAWYLPRLARSCGVATGDAAWLGLASPVVLIHLVGGMHNEALMVGLMVAGLAVAAAGRSLPAGVLLGLAAAVKVTAVVVAPFAALLLLAGAQRRIRELGAVALGWVAAFGAVTVLSGLGLGWIGGLKDSGVTVHWTSLPTGVGMAVAYLGKAFGAAGWRPEAVAAARAVGVVVLCLLLVWLWWRVRHASRRIVVLHAGLALLATAFLGPVFHPWYALWALPVLAASIVDTRWSMGTAVIASALAFLVLPDGYNLARSLKLPGALFAVAVTVALIALLVRNIRPKRGVSGISANQKPNA